MRIATVIALLLVTGVSTAAQSTDPYLWMEEIEGPRPLEQFKAWNVQTETRLAKVPGYAEREARALKL